MGDPKLDAQDPKAGGRSGPSDLKSREEVNRSMISNFIFQNSAHRHSPDDMTTSMPLLAFLASFH